MINLIDKISPLEKDLIKDYIFEYSLDEGQMNDISLPRFAGVDKILAPWNEAKQNLYKLLGNNLIISKDVSFNGNEEDIAAEIEFYYKDKNSPISVFINNYKKAVANLYHDIPENEKFENYNHFEKLYNTFNYLTSFEALAKNRIGDLRELTNKLPMPNGKTITFNSNTKITKILSKLSTILNIEGFEDFRILHSQILNKKRITGKLTLSIHPLDYMTMSDNDCNWDSCMSWQQCGCYRQGTVEMMNSKSVIVAYVTSDKPMHLFGGDYDDDKWSNKKWRCLFVITDEFITKIKSYPYQHEILEKEVLNWIADLSEKNLNISYEPEIIEIAENQEDNIIYKDKCISLTFGTNNMYNDFGTTISYARLNDKIFDIDTENLSFVYSGASECMWCGETDIDFSNTSYLICDDCNHRHYCDYCGDRLSEYEFENYVLDNGMHFCEYCYDVHCVEDVLTGEKNLKDNQEEIFVVESTEAIKEIERNFLDIECNYWIDFYNCLKKCRCYSFWMPKNIDSNDYCDINKIIKIKAKHTFDRDVNLISYEDCCTIIKNNYDCFNDDLQPSFFALRYPISKEKAKKYPRANYKSKNFNERLAHELFRLGAPDKIYNILFPEENS